MVGLRRNRRDNNEDIVLVMNVGENYTDDQYLDKLAAKVADANRKLPIYTQLNRAIVTPNKLPLVSGIKVKRIELKRMYAEGELTYRELDLHGQNVGAEVAAAARIETKSAKHDEILKKVRTMYAEALEISESEITDNANFIEDLQGDSLQVLSIALKAEEEWGITIPAEEYGSCATVAGMAQVVETLLEGPAESDKPKERVPVRPISRFEDTPEYKHFLERQEALVGKGDNPYFVAHESPLLDTGIIDGKEVLEFGSYNYVGMSGRKEVKDAAKAAIDKYGTSASGSRLLAGEKQVHKDLLQAVRRDLQAFPPQRYRCSGNHPEEPACLLRKGSDCHRRRLQHGRRYRPRAGVCADQEGIRLLPHGGRSPQRLRHRQDRRRRG